MLHLPTIWNHLHIEDSCGFQWHDVDAVTLEFPLDLHNTSPEYFHHHDWAYQSRRTVQLLVGDPVPIQIADHFSTSLTIAVSGILEDLLAFLIQSPACFHNTLQND